MSALDVILDGERPEPAGPLAATRACARRALLRLRHVPEQLVDATIGPLLLLITFTYLFGGAIAGSTGAYLDFVLPGILVLAVLLTTPYAGIALAQDKAAGILDRLRSLPSWSGAPLAGAVIGDAVRAAMAGAVVLAGGLVLGFDAPGGVSGIAATLGVVVLFSFALSWVFAFIGLIARSQAALQGLLMTAVFLVVFVSTVFVAADTLPPVLEAIVGVNPVSHLADAARGLLAGSAAAGDVVLVLAECAALTAIFGPLTWRAMRRG